MSGFVKNQIQRASLAELDARFASLQSRATRREDLFRCHDRTFHLHFGGHR